MLWKLIKLRLQGIFSRTLSRKKPGSKGTLILFAVLMVYCIGVFAFLFYNLFGIMADTLAAAPQYHWFYFGMIGLLSFGLSFFFTAFTAKSELFEAKDNDLLLSMPIKPRLILISRMAILLGMEYLISLLVMVPAGAAWFLSAGFDFRQFILYCIGSLILPLLSASIACLVGWLLALLTSRARNKTLVTMAFSLIFLAIYFVVYFNAQQYITQLMQNYQAVADGMMGWGFLYYWYGEGIASADLLRFGAVVLLTLAVFAVAILLLSKGFLKVSSAGSKSRKKEGKPELQSRNLSSALLRRELKRFISSSIYMLNCGMGLLITLIAAVALLIKADAIRGLLALVPIMGLPMNELDLALMVSLLMSFLCSMDDITAPSVSLEGKNLWILRSAPIPTKMILAAKMKMHLLLCAPVTLVLSVAAAIVMRTNWLGWLVLILVPQIFILLSGAFGLAMNLRFPKLDWTNEAVPVKQSASVVVTMLLMMAYTILVVIGFFLLVANGILGVTAYLMIALGAAVVWLLLSLLWLSRNGVRRFNSCKKDNGLLPSSATARFLIRFP